MQYLEPACVYQGPYHTLQSTITRLQHKNSLMDWISLMDCQGAQEEPEGRNGGRKGGRKEGRQGGPWNLKPPAKGGRVP